MNQHLPSSELVIRPASFNDISFIREIVNQTWPLTYTKIVGKEQVDYMMDRIYSQNSLEDQMKNQHYFFLELKHFMPIGFASFSHIEGSVFKLQKLYVLPNVQKTGAGKALLETVETVAKSMGATKLLLHVNRQNIARTFYEKNGYHIIESVDIDIENGYFMNDYVMGKEFSK